MYPKVYIIILNWNGLKDTIECLRSVRGLDYPNFRTIVVDNGSKDSSGPELRRHFKEVEVIENDENLGYTGGNNVGIRRAIACGADYVWLLNNDTIVTENSLSRMVSLAEEDTSTGMVSPLIYFHSLSESIQFCGGRIHFEIPAITLFKSPEEYESSKDEPISLWGTALLVKKSVLDTIGLLDERFFAYGEDEDYSIKAHLAGFRNRIQPEAKIFHKDSRSTGGRRSPHQMFLRMRNQFFLWHDKLSGIERFAYKRRYVAFVISHLAELQRENLNEALEAGLDGVWAAFKDRFGPWDRSVRMPRWMRIIFKGICSWHPYFWCLLLTAEGTRIASETWKRFPFRRVPINP